MSIVDDSKHIFGFGDKVVSDSTGILYDSGGPTGVYNAHEEDYFILRRTSTDYSAHAYILLDITEWGVHDYDVSSTDYDYIDVYTSDNGFDPSTWTWVERFGGIDVNSSWTLPVKYYLQARHMKLVFRSSFRQDYSYTGFKIFWSTSSSNTGYTDLAGVAANTYIDEANLKENAMDSQEDVDRYVLQQNDDPTGARDPGTGNWDFIPPGQLSNQRDLHVLNHRFTNLNYGRGVSTNIVPLSYTSPERIHGSNKVGDISIER